MKLKQIHNWLLTNCRQKKTHSLFSSIAPPNAASSSSAHPIIPTSILPSLHPATGSLQAQHPPPDLLRPSSTTHPLSSHAIDYLLQLSASISNHQLSPATLSQALNYLKSNDLFSSLSPHGFNLLIDYDPTTHQEESSHSTHYYLYHRIFFLLDRIYELDHLFTHHQLGHFHSLCLKQFSQVGLFRPAELVWDQLILPHSSQSQPHPRDQMLMIDCIRNALLNHQSTQTTSHHTSQSILQDYQDQDLLPLIPKDIKRMITLSESIGNSLASSTNLGPIAERWTVRTVAEILGIQTQTSKLANWLIKTRSLDMDFPDQGASWTDPKLTAIVVKMFKDQNQLENMITIYEAACHPSPTMLSHPYTLATSQKVAFDSSSSQYVHSSTAQPPSTRTEQRKRNPILTRTYHDLILASGQANRPHLAIHFLTQAVERNESYVRNLLLKHPPKVNFPPIPALRLQPATFSELIPNLVRKKRDTQLKTLLELTHRLVRSTVEELNWIRSLALNRSSAFPSETFKWQTVLNSIVPNLNSQLEENRNLELEKSENLMLEKLVFTHNNQPSKFLSTMATTGIDDKSKLESNASKDKHQDHDEGELNQDSNSIFFKQSQDQAEEEIHILRVLERTKFLSKSLIHSIKLIKRLEPIIHKTKINRALRLETNLLNQKSKSSSKPKSSKPGNDRYHQSFFNQNLPPAWSASKALNTPNINKIQQRIERLKLQKKTLIHN